MKLADLVVEQDEETAEPTYVFPDTADVAQHIFPLLQKKIEKLNKRARKNKLPEIKLEVVKEFMKEVKPSTAEGGIEEPSHHIPYYTIKITGDAPVVGGYKFIATIEHQQGGNIIRMVPGEEAGKKIKDFYEAKPDYCDHCKKVRRRIDTFIVKEEKTGKLRQIGRNCLADFLGGASPAAILAYFSTRNEIHKLIQDVEGSVGGRSARVEQFVPLEDVLKTAHALISARGYMSTKKSQELGGPYGGGPATTAQDVRWFYFGLKRLKELGKEEIQKYEIMKAAGPVDAQKTKEVLDWFKAIPEKQKQDNDFMHNVDVLVKSDKVNSRNFGYVIALFPLYARAMDQIKPKVQRSNEYVGQTGQKLPPTKVKVIRTRNISGPYGTTQIVAMEDEKGNQLTWFNNSRNNMEEGKEYTITGTIKKHDEYKGRRQTHILRVKTI